MARRAKVPSSQSAFDFEIVVSDVSSGAEIVSRVDEPSPEISTVESAVQPARQCECARGTIEGQPFRTVDQ